jgi:protease I
MNSTPDTIKVAILATDGYEQSELLEPKQTLEEAGITVHVISDRDGVIQGYRHEDKGDTVAVDQTFDQVNAGDYDAVVLPGGVINSDAIRLLPQAQIFVRQLDAAGKPIAVICHGAWLMISADAVRGRALTSWPSLRDDIRNAGGIWLDQELVKDRNLISSRSPQALPAFNRALLAALQHAAEPAEW